MSTGEEKAFDKIQLPFMIKALSKVIIRGTHLNTKASCDKLTTNIILNRQQLKSFPSRLGARQGCLLSALSVSTVPEVLATAVRQEEK